VNAVADLPGLETISCLDQGRDPAGFARRLGASFREHGFAVLGDHGLDAARIEAATQVAKAVFALPEAIKRRYLIAGGAGQRGYTPFAVETAKGERHADLKEFWHVGQDGNVWPSEIAGFRNETLWLYRSLEALGIRVMRAIADDLGEPPDSFEAAVTGGDSILRLLHYPPAAFDGPAIRAGAHEDINAITLLLGAEEAGLEILDRSGRWLAVNPPPGAVVVNIGDMLARLTNGVLPSTTHRVVNPAPERRGVARYSTPFFLHFRPEFTIETLASCVSAERPDRHPEPTTAAAFLAQRLRDIGLA
jgi:isopenicillin N synthase-like dioxygenase